MTFSPTGVSKWVSLSKPPPPFLRLPGKDKTCTECSPCSNNPLTSLLGVLFPGSWVGWQESGHGHAADLILSTLDLPGKRSLSQYGWHMPWALRADICHLCHMPHPSYLPIGSFTALLSPQFSWLTSSQPNVGISHLALHGSPHLAQHPTLPTRAYQTSTEWLVEV